MQADAHQEYEKHPNLGALEVNTYLKQLAIDKLKLLWFSDQISVWLQVEYSSRKSIHVSHETIYKS